MRIDLVTPAPPRSRDGNRRTALRWARMLRSLGHAVHVEQRWASRRTELLIALHARRSHDSIESYARAHPDRPLVVALTGTDLYRDIRSDARPRRSLARADRLIVLQPLALAELDPQQRAKARVVIQSAEPVRRTPPAAPRFFDVLVLGHLRPEKDPIRAALAARLLPAASRVRIVHLGRAYDADQADAARAEAAANRRYRWVGEVGRGEVRRRLGRARLLAHTSVLEGGANVISEALAAGVAVVASDIPGNIGLLGEDHPGLYPAGDERALAELLHRAEAEPAFLAALERAGGARAPLVAPEREREALRALVSELAPARRPLSSSSPSGMAAEPRSTTRGSND